MNNTLYKNLTLARLILAVLLKRKAGIFQLVNLQNNKTYVGS
jgi:hypothetical protein